MLMYVLQTIVSVANLLVLMDLPECTNPEASEL